MSRFEWTFRDKIATYTRPQYRTRTLTVSYTYCERSACTFYLLTRKNVFIEKKLSENLRFQVSWSTILTVFIEELRLS